VDLSSRRPIILTEIWHYVKHTVRKNFKVVVQIVFLLKLSQSNALWSVNTKKDENLFYILINQLKNFFPVKKLKNINTTIKENCSNVFIFFFTLNTVHDALVGGNLTQIWVYSSPPKKAKLDTSALTCKKVSKRGDPLLNPALGLRWRAGAGILESGEGRVGGCCRP
jgi:hypothetical protein